MHPITYEIRDVNLSPTDGDPILHIVYTDVMIRCSTLWLSLSWTQNGLQNPLLNFWLNIVEARWITHDKTEFELIQIQFNANNN